MKFYSLQHKYYCGIDLHARKMYVCIINHKGKVKVHMNIKTRLQHVALQNTNKKKTEIFFKKILGLQHIKTFTLTKEVTNEIFGINIDVQVYNNGKTQFEIFITKNQKDYGFEHTCIEINNKEEFIKRCKKYDIKLIFIKKGEKTLLFVKDFSGNLFEIKEKQLH